MSDYITEDDLLQILKWLPAKSLLRFRSVCKGWKQLIDSPSLIQDHLGVQKPRCILSYGETQFLVLDSRNLPSFDTLSGPVDDNPQRFDIVGTLHGIVCLGNDEGVFSLWNPAIRKFLCLPRPEFMEFDLLGYNINEMSRFCGFWMDPLTKDFKVIFYKLYSLDPNDAIHGTLFSSSLQYWRVLELFPLEEGRNCHGLEENPPVVINEMGYWRAYYEDEGKDSMNVIVLSFDFVQERFDIIEAPSVEYTDYTHPVVSNWRGSLSLVYVDPADQRCSIFLRQQGLWINIFAFYLPCYICRLLCVLGETEERIRILATMGHGQELVLCDTKTGCDTLMSQLQEDSEELYVACGFVESLLFP